MISGENDFNTAEAELSPGYFGLHVGYAPGFSDTADLSRAWNDEGQVKYEGLGEMGRIMGEFIFNKMREARRVGRGEQSALQEAGLVG